MSSVVRSITQARRSKARPQRLAQPALSKRRSVSSATQFPAPTPPRLTVISNPSLAANVSPRRVPAANSVVRQMPQAGAMPAGLRVLMRTHKASIIFAFVVGIAALVVYGSTVYTQQLWSKEYRKLKTLQRSERELLAAGESLKGQLAQQAERPDSQLVSKSPSSLLFLKPEPPRTTPALPPVVTGTLNSTVNKLQPTSKKPLGY